MAIYQRHVIITTPVNITNVIMTDQVTYKDGN